MTQAGRQTVAVDIRPMSHRTVEGEPIDRFRLQSGHTVTVYRAGELGMPIYFDHQVVMLEDAGGRNRNRQAASAAVSHQKR